MISMMTDDDHKDDNEHDDDDDDDDDESPVTLMCQPPVPCASPFWQGVGGYCAD